jgi:hypothetical protein
MAMPSALNMLELQLLKEISLGICMSGNIFLCTIRTGRRQVNGMLNDGVNSLSRYYINNFKGTKYSAY